MLVYGMIYANGKDVNESGSYHTNRAGKRGQERAIDHLPTATCQPLHRHDTSAAMDLTISLQHAGR